MFDISPLHGKRMPHALASQVWRDTRNQGAGCPCIIFSYNMSAAAFPYHPFLLEAFREPEALMPATPGPVG
jgi:hypothetical protein